MTSTLTPTTVPSTEQTATATTARARRPWLIRTGVYAGLIAAAAVGIVAAAARAADVPLEIDGETIPLLGFVQMTLLGAALGVVMAAFARGRQPFVIATVVATALSVMPSLTLPEDTATKVVLVATHLLAALIVVPSLARRLPAGRS